MVTVSDVVNATAWAYSIHPTILVAPPRGENKISHARQLAYFVAREKTGYSFPKLGKCFKRHHTTVLYACQLMPDRLREDADLAGKYTAIIALVDEAEAKRATQRAVVAALADTIQAQLQA